MLDNIDKLIEDFKTKKVLVIGDIMLDQYTYGSVTRVSPEAPVPVLRKTKEDFTLGGAANVANNIATLGSQVTLMGVVGNDPEKAVLSKLLKEKQIDARGILVHHSKPTILKHRFIAGTYQIGRFDNENTDNLSTEDEQKLLTFIKNEIFNCDIVVFSDYDKGLFTKTFTQEIIRLAREVNKKIIADFKPQKKDIFMGVDLISPNLKEARAMTDLEDPRDVGLQLVRDFDADLLMTMGAQGAYLFERTGSEKKIEVKTGGVVDVSGAGDTVVAVLAISLATDNDFETASKIAIKAAEIAVQKMGVATVTKEELLNVLQSGPHVDQIDLVQKVWGTEKWLENNDKYCCKVLSLNKDYQCSLHYHKVKDETFFVTKGHVALEVEDEVKHLRVGNFVRIQPGTKHRFKGVEDSTIIEISTHHMEDDSYRLEVSRKSGETKHDEHPKIKSIQDIVNISNNLKAQGKKIVTLNGSFDILNPGHIQALEEAKEQGDVFIVLVNSDKSIKSYKGPLRPINEEYERALVLAALACIDYVAIFDDINPKRIIDELKPHVHCNSEDRGMFCLEREIVEKHGGRIHLLKKTHATTNVIENILTAYSQDSVKAVFLDRDGTINLNKQGYIYKKEDFEYTPGAIEVLKKISESDYKIIIVTNQSGIGRGYYKESDMEKLHEWMVADLARHGIKVDKIYNCPHRPDDCCECRKPGIGMLMQAVEEFDISLNDSWLIGDGESDVLAGREVNVKTIKLGKRMDKSLMLEPDYYADDLLAALDIIFPDKSKREARKSENEYSYQAFENGLENGLASSFLDPENDPVVQIDEEKLNL